MSLEGGREGGKGMEEREGEREGRGGEGRGGEGGREEGGREEGGREEGERGRGGMTVIHIILMAPYKIYRPTMKNYIYFNNDVTYYVIT